jgi:hypothetical protein
MMPRFDPSPVMVTPPSSRTFSSAARVTTAKPLPVIFAEIILRDTEELQSLNALKNQPGFALSHSTLKNGGMMALRPYSA